MLFVCQPNPRETEDNAYAEFWGDKQRVLWYVMVFYGAFNGVLVHYSFLVYFTCCEAHLITMESCAV